jgi:glycosyltransferase involved in cell wall biosynthesis
MSRRQKVLLADPVMVSHSLLYYEAALASAGFEETQFTVATTIVHQEDRQRALEFCRSRPRLKLHALEVDPGPCITRWQCWRGFRRAMAATEQILRKEPFDLVAYVAMDVLLVFFALPFFRRTIPAHFQAGVAGTLFRDNGLRPPIGTSVKARLRSRIDLWILRRALHSGGLRRAAFLDHYCADRAKETLNSDICAYGVDPVFPEPCDPVAARAQFGLEPGDFAILLFGLLSDRKGILESLAMLRNSPLPKEKTVLIVAGPSGADVRQRLEEELAATGRHYRLIRHDRFIQRGEMPPYFAAADCLICVYKEFSGSSSVLLHGATYGKPAVVSPGGVMEDAVRRHNFGEVAGVNDPAAFSAAICRLANMPAPERQALAERARRYGASMDARRYMSQFS